MQSWRDTVGGTSTPCFFVFRAALSLLRHDMPIAAHEATAEQRVMGDGLRGRNPVVLLAAALQLVESFGAVQAINRLHAVVSPVVLVRRVVFPAARSGPSRPRHGAYGFFGVLYSATFWNGSQMVS